MRDLGILTVGKLLGVLILLVAIHGVGQVLKQEPLELVVVCPVRAILLIEGAQDARKNVKLRRRRACTGFGRCRVNLDAALKLDFDCRLLLCSVAVHVNAFQNSRRQISIVRRGQLGGQELKKRVQAFLVDVAERQDGREKLVGADERLSPGLELDLLVGAQVVLEHVGAGVQNRIKLLPTRAFQELLHDGHDLHLIVDLKAVELVLQVVEPVQVSFFAENGSLVE